MYTRIGLIGFCLLAHAACENPPELANSEAKLEEFGDFFQCMNTCEESWDACVDRQDPGFDEERAGCNNELATCSYFCTGKLKMAKSAQIPAAPAYRNVEGEYVEFVDSTPTSQAHRRFLEWMLEELTAYEDKPLALLPLLDWTPSHVAYSAKPATPSCSTTISDLIGHAKDILTTSKFYATGLNLYYYDSFSLIEGRGSYNGIGATEHPYEGQSYPIFIFGRHFVRQAFADPVHALGQLLGKLRTSYDHHCMNKSDPRLNWTAQIKRQAAAEAKFYDIASKYRYGVAAEQLVSPEDQLLAEALPKAPYGSLWIKRVKERHLVDWDLFELMSNAFTQDLRFNLPANQSDTLRPLFTPPPEVIENILPKIYAWPKELVRKTQRYLAQDGLLRVHSPSSTEQQLIRNYLGTLHLFLELWPSIIGTTYALENTYPLPTTGERYRAARKHALHFTQFLLSVGQSIFSDYELLSNLEVIPRVPTHSYHLDAGYLAFKKWTELQEHTVNIGNNLILDPQ